MLTNVGFGNQLLETMKKEEAKDYLDDLVSVGYFKAEDIAKLSEDEKFVLALQTQERLEKHENI